MTNRTGQGFRARGRGPSGREVCGEPFPCRLDLPASDWRFNAWGGLALHGFLPAVILSDLRPGREQRGHPPVRWGERSTGPDIPLAVISSTNLNGNKLNHDADEYVAKPVDGAHRLAMPDLLTDRRPDTLVLRVDDAEVTPDVLRQMLPLNRYSVRTARDRQECSQQPGAARPDRLLIELAMREMDGDEFVQCLPDVSAEAGIAAAILTPAKLTEPEPVPLHSVSRMEPEGEPTSTQLVAVIQMALRQTEAARAP